MAYKIIILHERPQVEIVIKEETRSSQKLIRDRILHRGANKNSAAPSLLQGLFQPKRAEIAAQETTQPNHRLLNGREQPLLPKRSSPHNDLIIQVESRYTGLGAKSISPHGKTQISLTISLPSAAG